MVKRGRRTPNQERARASVDALLEASAQILVEEGYARLSTNHIAKRAGVSVGTLYQYFADKDAIVEALVTRLAEERLRMFHQVLTDVVAREVPLPEAVRIMFDATLAAMRVRPALSRVLILEAPRGGRFDLERAWLQRGTELVTAVLYRGESQVRSGDKTLMAHVLVTGVFAVLQHAVAHRPELLEGHTLSEELVTLAARYLSPAPEGL